MNIFKRAMNWMKRDKQVAEENRFDDKVPDEITVPKNMVPRLRRDRRATKADIKQGKPFGKCKGPFDYAPATKAGEPARR